jgi:hypothetical protein
MEFQHAAAGSPDRLQIATKDLGQQVGSQLRQQLPELVLRDEFQTPNCRSVELTVLDFGYFADKLGFAQIDAPTEFERAAMPSQHLGAHQTGQNRPHVPSRRGIDPGNAHETLLHPSQMVDDDLHD